MGKRTAKMIDEEALAAFSQAMSEKLAQKRGQGYSGWHKKNECALGTLWEMLQAHVKKAERAEEAYLDETQLVDIANLAMFLWSRRAEFPKTFRFCDHCGNAATSVVQQ